MESYTGALAEEVERRRVYRMLRLEVSARPDGTLEARGVLIEGLRVGTENGRVICPLELALSCIAGRRMQRNILRYRRPSALGPPLIEPPVPPLFEPRLPQRICSHPCPHIPFCKLVHELVVHFAVASERYQPLLSLSLVFSGQPP